MGGSSTTEVRGWWAPAWIATILISMAIEMADRSDSELGTWFLIPALAGAAGLIVAAVALWRRWPKRTPIAFGAASLAALLYAIEAIHVEASWSEVLLALLWVGIAFAVPSLLRST